MNQLPEELKQQIEKEAEAKTVKFKVDNDYQLGYKQGVEVGYYACAEVYALKLWQAEAMMEKMVNKLRLIEQMSDPGSYEKAVYDMKSISSDVLAEYNNYKQAKDDTING